MLDITEKDCRQKLRDEFMKNAHIKDPTAVDLIVVKVRHKAVCQTTHKCMRSSLTDQSIIDSTQKWIKNTYKCSILCLFCGENVEMITNSGLNGVQVSDSTIFCRSTCKSSLLLGRA